MKPEHLNAPSSTEYMLDILTRQQAYNPTEPVTLRTSETVPERSLSGHITTERLPTPPSLAISLSVNSVFDRFPIYSCQFHKRGMRHSEPIFFISAVTENQDPYALRMFSSSEQSGYKFLPMTDTEQEPVTLRLWTPEWFASTVRYPYPPASPVDTASLRALARRSGYPNESQIPTVPVDPKHTLDKWVAICTRIFMENDFGRPGKLPPFVLKQ